MVGLSNQRIYDVESNAEIHSARVAKVKQLLPSSSKKKLSR